MYCIITFLLLGRYINQEMTNNSIDNDMPVMKMQEYIHIKKATLTKEYMDLVQQSNLVQARINDLNQLEGKAEKLQQNINYVLRIIK